MPEAKPAPGGRKFYYFCRVLQRDRLDADVEKQLNEAIDLVAMEGWVLDSITPLESRSVIILFRLDVMDGTPWPTLTPYKKEKHSYALSRKA